MSQLLQGISADPNQATLRSRTQESFLPPTPYTTGFADNRRSAKGSSYGSSSVRPLAQREQQARAVENPLADIISNELFNTLLENDLLNEKALRDFMIRQQFKKLKAESNMRTMDVMSELQRMYPYLQLDTIRKIVYRVYPTSGKKPML